MNASAPPYLSCPHCATQNRSDQRTCYACQKPLAGEVTGEQTDAPPTATTFLVTCTKCHRRMRVSADLHRRALAGATTARCSRCSETLDVNAATPEAPGAASPVVANSAQQSGLHGVGWTLVVLGAVGLVFAIFTETSVASSSDFGGYGADRVHNIGLLARQVVVAVAAGLTLVAGAVFVVAGYLSDLREVALKR